jgi:hypothetical protein
MSNRDQTGKTTVNEGPNSHFFISLLANVEALATDPLEPFTWEPTPIVLE